MRSALGLSAHAAARYRERVGVGRPAPAASVVVPWREAAARWPIAPGHRKGRGQVRVSAAALWIVHGRTAVTCLALAVEDLAAVLVWLLFGEWT